MPTLDTNTLSVVLKEIIDPIVRKPRDESSAFLDALEEGKAQQTSARGVKIIADVQPNPSMKWFNEGEAYSTGSGRRLISMNVFYTRFVIASRLTRDVIEHESVDAVVNILADDTIAHLNTARKELNQQACSGDGTGTKAIVGTVSGNTITCSGPFGSRRLLLEGQYDIHAGSSRTGINVGDKLTTTPLVVQSRNVSAGTVTFTTAVPSAVASGDVIVFAGSYGKALHGLRYIISDSTGTFQGVSRTTYPQLNSFVDDASGAALSVAMLNKHLAIRQFARGERVDSRSEIWSGPTQLNAYLNLGNPVMVTNANPLLGMPAGQTLNLGYSGTSIKFGNLTWRVDVDIRPDEIYFLDRSLINRYTLKPLSVVPLVGGSKFAPVPAFDSLGNGSYLDAAVYFLTCKMDLGSPDPQAAGSRITNLSTTGLATGFPY